MARRAEAIEAANSLKTESRSKKKPGRKAGTKAHPNSIKNLKPFQPGVSGNPGGRPKRDLSAEIARGIFENNPELIYDAFTSALKRGSPYAFQVLSDRGYGKLKDSVEVSGLEGLADAIARARQRASAPRK